MAKKDSSHAKNSNSKKGNSNASKSEKIVRAPLAQGTVTQTKAPQVTNTTRTSTCVVHRERFVQYTTASQPGFGTFRINPGQALMFPWGSTIARNYDQFRFKKLHFIWKSRCSADSNGQIVFATDYDATDTPAQSLSVLESFEGARAANIWIDNVIFKCDIAKLHPNGKRKYVCLTPYCPDSDILDVFCGRFDYACDSVISPATTVGEFWVDYEVEFYGSQTITGFSQSSIETNNAVANSVQNRLFAIHQHGPQTINGNITGNAFGTGGGTVIVSPNGGVVISAGGTVSGLVSGTVKVNYMCNITTTGDGFALLLIYINGNQMSQEAAFPYNVVNITGDVVANGVSCNNFVGVFNLNDLNDSNILAVSIQNNNASVPITLENQFLSIEYI